MNKSSSVARTSLMELTTIQEQIEKSINWFNANAENLAIAKANYEQKDDFKKTELACAEIRNSGNTQAEIARNALADPKYKDFLNELSEVRLEYLKAKCIWEAKMAAFEGLRSLNKNLQ